MARLDTTVVAGLFNALYPDGIEELIMGESPILGMIGKEIDVWDGLGGLSKDLLWDVALGTGASGSYAVAYANPGNNTYARPHVTRGRLFAVRQIDHESWRASKGNNRAYRDLVKEASKGAIRELKKRVSSLLPGNAGGVIGRISAGSNVGTATITLSDISQIINFGPSMRVQAVDPATMTLRSAGAVATLTATGINFDTGELTFTGNLTAAIAAAVASDYLVPEGDLGNVPTNMEAWNPRTLIAVGAGDSFFGIDRGGNSLMQGFRWTATTGTIDEIAVEAAARHQSMGGEHDTLLINPRDMATLNLNLFKAITVNAQSSRGKELATVAYDGIIIKTGKGDIKAFSDPFQPRGRMRLTRMGSWKIWSLGEMFGLMDEGMGKDGMLRIAGADASYMVFGGAWQMVNECPRDSFNIGLPGAPA